MSTLEVNTIDTISGTTDLTIGGSNNTGSTTIKTNNTNAVTIDSSQNLKFNSGYGSVATAYGCRAWVNFNGTGTVAIRGSGNITSITDNGTGDYTLNFTSAMPDANYAVFAMGNSDASIAMRSLDTSTSRTTSLVRIQVLNVSFGVSDTDIANATIFR